MQDRINLNLRQNFGQGMCVVIEDFFWNRLIFQPPHMMDFMDEGHKIFNSKLASPHVIEEPIQWTMVTL
jgi:hypothetical protein